MLCDVLEAIRSVGRHARFSVLVCVILAVGIGATTLAFANSAVLFINSTIRHPERLGWLFSVDMRHANDRVGVSLPDYLDVRDRAHAFESLAARTGTTLTLTGRGQASRLGAYQVTANLLDIWGLPVAIGRGFREGEDLPNAAGVVVISNRLWQTILAADPSVVGSTLMLDGVARTIVGVLDSHLDTAFSTVDLWVPFDLGAARRTPRTARLLTVFGVLKSGVTVAQAHAEAHSLAMQLAAEHPDTNEGWDARVVDTYTGRTSPQTYYNIFLESIASALVLFTGCVNVALLLTSRGVGRQKEISVRLALGARRLRLARQQALEGLLIAVPAVLIGFGLTVLGIHLLRMSADPYYKRVVIDWQLFSFAASISVLTPLIFGFVPAIQLLRGQVPLTTGGWTAGQSGRSGRRTQRALATAQIGAALILLIMSALVLRSLAASLLTDVGFDPKQVSTVGLSLPAWKYPDRQTLPRVFVAFVDRVARVPRISDAAASTVVPALSAGPSVATRLDSEAVSIDKQDSAQLAIVTPRLFDSVGISVLAGRDFTSDDKADTPLVAIVNRQFAARYGNNPQDVVGRQLAIRGESSWREIVGIVGNTRNVLGGDVPPFVYVPHTQEPVRMMFLVARITEGSSLEPVRRAIAEVDPDVAPYQLRTVREAIRRGQSGDLAQFGELGVLAAVSVILAALGLFGAFSCLVAERRRDFALRLALGASPRDVSRMILKEGLFTVLPGVLAGVLGGALLSRFAIGVVYGFTANPYDPVVYTGSVLLLLMAALAALAGPARRARLVQVAEILRSS